MSKILSISIAAYNVEGTIEKCLDSFLPCRNLEEIEILVINDGSTDRTEEIVTSYEKKYPKSIRLINKENGGHGSTLNKSLEIATGTFFKAIDGDDWVSPDDLDKLCDYLKTTDADLVIDDYREVYPKYNRVVSFGKDKIKGKVYKFNDIFSNKKISDVHFIMANSTIKTCNLRKVGTKIQENCFYADTELYFFIGLSVEKVAYIDSVTYQYRLGSVGQSVSVAGFNKHIEDLIKIELNLMRLYVDFAKHSNSEIREKYLFSIISTRYNLIFSCFNKIIENKDHVLIEFNQIVKSEYPEIYKKLRLDSVIYRFVEKDLKKRLPFVRFLLNTPVFRALRKIKYRLNNI